jgi:hypothetical protein
MRFRRRTPSRRTGRWEGLASAANRQPRWKKCVLLPPFSGALYAAAQIGFFAHSHTESGQEIK